MCVAEGPLGNWAQWRGIAEEQAGGRELFSH